MHITNTQFFLTQLNAHGHRSATRAKLCNICLVDFMAKVCDECSMQFKDNAELGVHLRQNHQKEESLQILKNHNT